MTELTSVDSYMQHTETYGDLKVFCILGIPDLNPRLLLGQNVALDGIPYYVAGVDTYTLPDATGTNFGLMVRPISE